MIFVDTSFWVALRNRRDANHHAAAALWQRHADGALITSNHVRGETWTFLRRRAGHEAAVNFLDLVAASPRVVVVQVSETLERTALKWLRQHDEREYSFVDASSFALMHSERMTQALTFDGDFAAAGFEELQG